jgi:enoyl-CoA hydratase/carnithine racemase
MTEHIEVTIASGVQTLRLMRPQKKNALTREMYSALATALKSGEEARNVRAHVILGSGGSFSAGNDLADFMSREGEGTIDGPVIAFLTGVLDAKKPLVAGVDGPAVGIGTTLLLHCDLVYASPAATFKTPFLDLGLVPEAASSLLLPMRMGHARAFDMLCLGTVFDARRAEAAGLVNAIVPAPELDEHTIGAARRLAQKPATALALSRKLLRGSNELVRVRMQEEFRQFKERLTSPEAQEAFRAFFEKRPPDFTKIENQG